MFTDLDLRHLFTFTIFITLAQLLILIHTRKSRRTYPGFRCWIAALAFNLATVLLTRVFRPVLPTLVVYVVGNSCLLVSGELIYRGIALYCDLPWRRLRNGINGAIVLLATVLLWYFSAVHDERAGRIVITMAAAGILYLGSGLEPLFVARRRYAVLPLFSAVMTCFGLLFVLRALSMTPLGGTGALFPTADDLLRLIVIAGIFAHIIMIYCFIAMTGERLERELAESEAKNLHLTELQRQQAEQARRTAETANLAKSEFLATMSHEIRSPLHALLGAASLLSNERTESRRQRYAELVTSSGEALHALIDDLLDLSRIEAGKLELNPRPVDLALLTRQVIRMFGEQAAAKGITLRCHLQPDAVTAVTVDRQRLLQILVNLVGNAVKFTDSGSVTVTVSNLPTLSGPLTLFTVDDTGPGIPDDIRTRIFDPFFRHEVTHGNDKPGTGLGLGIVARLTAAMDGTLDLVNKPEAGSRFIVTLPLPPAPLIEHGEEVIRLTPLSPLRILAVDDIAVNREILHYYLEDQPVELMEASSGAEAVDRFMEIPFDCVLLDMQMPGMSGYETTRALRRIEVQQHRQRTTIVGISAGAFTVDTERALAAGCDVYLARPLSSAALLKVIHDRVIGTPATETQVHHHDERDGSLSGEQAVSPVDAVLLPLVRKALTRLATCADDLEAAAHEGRFTDAARIGHIMRGIGAQFGLTESELLGKEVEAAAKENALGRLACLARRVREAARREFSQREQPAAPGE